MTARQCASGYCRDPAGLVTNRLSNARVYSATTVPMVNLGDETLFVSCCCDVITREKTTSPHSLQRFAAGRAHRLCAVRARDAQSYCGVLRDLALGRSGYVHRLNDNGTICRARGLPAARYCISSVRLSRGQFGRKPMVARPGGRFCLVPI